MQKQKSKRPQALQSKKYWLYSAGVLLILSGVGSSFSSLSSNQTAPKVSADTSSDASITLREEEDGKNVGTLGTAELGDTVVLPNEVTTDGVTYFLGIGQRDIGATTDQGDGTSSALLSANSDTDAGYEPIWYDSVKLDLGAARNVTLPYGSSYTPAALQTLTGTNGISGFYDLSASTLSVENPVNTHQAGTYTVTYTATIVGCASGQSVTTTTQQTVIVAPPLPNQAPITYSVVDDTTGSTLVPPTFFLLGTVGESLATPENLSQLQALEQSYQTGEYSTTLLTNVEHAALPAPQDAFGYDLTLHLADKIERDQLIGPSATVTQTIHYSGAGEKTPADEVQNFAFNATIEQATDLFTHQVSQEAPDWSAPQVSQPVVPPLLAGYAATPQEIPAMPYSHDASDATLNVNYSPLPASLTLLYQEVEPEGTQTLAEQKLSGVTDGSYDNTAAYNKEITALEKQGLTVVQTVPQKGTFAAGDTSQVIQLKMNEAALTLPKAIWRVDESSYQPGKAVQATLNQPMNNLDKLSPYRYSSWETSLTLPKEFQAPTVKLVNDKGEVIPTTEKLLSKNQVQLSVSRATMATLPFKGEDYHFIILGKLDSKLIDGTRLNFNATSQIAGHTASTPYRTGPIAHKVPIKVSYLRQASHDSVLKSQTLLVAYGKPWRVVPAKAPTGYSFDQASTTDPLSGKQVDFETKTVRLYYAPTEKTVHVNYVDEKGQKLAPETSFKAGYLDAYTTSAEDLDDAYSLVTDKLPKNAAGVMGNHDVTVTYVYRQTNGKWMDLGAGSRGITRLDYHGHIRSNALNYADGQIISLVNTRDGIELFQDTVAEGAVSEQAIQAGATRVINVSGSDRISVTVLGMGNVILTRQTPTYTMTTVIQKGNFSNTTKVYHGTSLIEEDVIQANGVTGLLTQSRTRQAIDGKLQLTATSLTKATANLSPNTTAIDAPATSFSSQIADDSTEKAAALSDKEQTVLSATASSETAASASTSASVSSGAPTKLAGSLTTAKKDFQAQKLSTTEASRLYSDLTASSSTMSSSSSVSNNNAAQVNQAGGAAYHDTMAANTETFTTKLTGSATLPDNAGTAFGASGATGDSDIPQVTEANFSGQVALTASENGKILKQETVGQSDAMTLTVPKADSKTPITLIIQPQVTGLAAGEKLANGRVLPLDHGSLPKTGVFSSTASKLLGMVLALSAGLLAFFKRGKEEDDA